MIGAPAGAVAVAFSGGGDSTALLAIAADWARARGARLIALHVDHGLRATSSADAARAAETARRLGADARTLVWNGPRPTRGVQAAARAARHRLLAGACAEIGADVLLVAHTLEDQAETVLMRLARAPATARALAGLEEIAPSPAWPVGAGLAIVRPLLDARRAELHARLTAAGLTFIDDPANADLAHERVRARALLARLGPGMALRLAGLAQRAQAAEEARRRAALGALTAFAMLPGGAFGLDRARFARHPRPARALALEAVLSAAAGRPGPRPPERLDRLLDRLAPGARFAGATLGGAVVARAAGDQLVIARDPGDLTGRRAAARPQRLDRGVWDGRFRLEEALGCEEKILPAQGLMSKLSAPDRDRLAAAPPIARRSCPIVVGPAGPRLAEGVFMPSQAIARRVLCRDRRAWSDDAAACVALGFRPGAPHMRRRRRTAEPEPKGSDRTGMSQA